MNERRSKPRMQDHYKILGVAPDATPEEIKKAFRELALKYHPDRNPDDPAAEARFKEVTNANDILGDPQKRAQYDRAGGPNFSGEASDLFGSAWNGHPPSAEEFINEFISQGFQHFTNAFQVNGIANLTLLDILNGATKKVKLTVQKKIMEGKRLRVVNESFERDIAFPPGFHPGMVMQMEVELEEDGFKKFQKVNINTQLENDTRYQLGPNGALATLMPISYPKAILGGTVDVDCFDGSKKKIKVPENTQPGQLIRIKGQGLPKSPRDKTRGDLIFQIAVDLPTSLSEEAKIALRKFQEELERQPPDKVSS